MIKLARIRWFGGFACHDHDLDLIQIEGPSPPVPRGPAPQVENGQPSEAEEENELRRQESPLSNRNGREPFSGRVF
jgi:hypothetical protein